MSELEALKFDSKILAACCLNIEEQFICKAADFLAGLDIAGNPSEKPYFDFKAAAKKHPNAVLAGEGDNRILTYGTKEDIRKMVERMAETGKECGGYLMCIGNHIPWNVPGESIKYYLDYSDKYAWR